MHFYLDLRKIMTKSLERDIKVKSTKSYCVLEYVEDNYYARFDTRSYHPLREIHFNARLDINNTKLDEDQDKVTRAQNLGQGHQVIVHACILRTITLQDLILPATTVTEKST